MEKNRARTHASTANHDCFGRIRGDGMLKTEGPEKAAQKK
jgi:hypothetical protein